MKGILRRIRGIVGTGIVWALGWAGGFAAWHWLGGYSLQNIGQTITMGLIWGFAAGGGFAVVLSIAERRHTLADLSLRRVALWGGIGGGSLVLATVLILSLVGIPMTGELFAIVLTVLLGVGFGTGTVALAKRADAKLIEGDDAEHLISEG